MPSPSKPSRYGLERRSSRNLGAKTKLDRASTRAKCGSGEETVFEIEQKTDEGQKIHCPGKLLDKESSIQRPGADSEEKHEPVSDIDTTVVDSLKALEPEWPIREAAMAVPQYLQQF